MLFVWSGHGTITQACVHNLIGSLTRLVVSTIQAQRVSSHIVDRDIDTPKVSVAVEWVARVLHVVPLGLCLLHVGRDGNHSRLGGCTSWSGCSLESLL